MIGPVLAVLAIDPPTGSLSPLAWTIIGVLCAVIVAICTYAKGWHGKMYDDLKACNELGNAKDEENLGLLKVIRLQMEESRGGKAR